MLLILACTQTYLFSILACPLDAALEVALAHIRALALAKAVVHEAVAQPHALLGFCEHHVADCMCSFGLSGCKGVAGC